MANIKVNLSMPIYNGMPVTFKAPADCSNVTGLRVQYPNGEDATASKDFIFADAHKNDLRDINELFKASAMVKVVLDTTDNMAFVQNADTNAYLEGRFNEYLPLTGGTLSGDIAVMHSYYPSIRVGFGDKASSIQHDLTSGTSYLMNVLGGDVARLALLAPSNNAVIFETISNGVYKGYNLYGDHNKSLLATTIQSLLAGGEISVVKSVQRGTTTATEITINAVNPDKCVVILDNGLLGVTGKVSTDKQYLVNGTTLVNLTATKLTIETNKSGTGGQGTVSWQVIEYY